LAFALTDKGYSLEAACAAFGVEHGKPKSHKAGEVTEAYIDYNRRDVLATFELAEKLLEEYEKHPINASGYKGILTSVHRQGILAGDGHCPDPGAPTGLSQKVFGLRTVGFLWRANQRSHPKTSRSRRLYGFSCRCIPR